MKNWNAHCPLTGITDAALLRATAQSTAWTIEEVRLALILARIFAIRPFARNLAFSL